MEKVMISALVVRQPLGLKGPSFTCKVRVVIEDGRVCGQAFVKGMESLHALDDFPVCDQTETEAAREMFDWILTKLEAMCLETAEL